MSIMENIPFCNIRIDKNGVWYYKGAEMFRREIVNFFYQNLRQDESGRYLIELPNDRCYLEVEDAPFVVSRSIVPFQKRITGQPSICSCLMIPWSPSIRKRSESGMTMYFTAPSRMRRLTPDFCGRVIINWQTTSNTMKAGTISLSG